MQTEPDQGSGEPGRKRATPATLDPLDLEADLPRVVETHDDDGHPEIVGAQHSLGLGLEQRIGREPGEYIGFESADRLPGERKPGKQPGHEADQRQQQDRQHVRHRNPADHVHGQDVRDRLREARNSLLQDLLYSQAVIKLGFVAGAGRVGLAASPMPDGTSYDTTASAP